MRKRRIWRHDHLPKCSSEVTAFACQMRRKEVRERPSELRAVPDPAVEKYQLDESCYLHTHGWWTDK